MNDEEKKDIAVEVVSNYFEEKDCCLLSHEGDFSQVITIRGNECEISGASFGGLSKDIDCKELSERLTLAWTYAGHNCGATCECGAEKVRSNIHSSWCPKAV